MKYILLDLGATWVKSGIGDTATGLLYDVMQEPFPPFLTGLDPSFREVDPQLVVDKILTCLENHIDGRHDIDGILVCGQMGGLILVNPDGTPATNFISWQDQRAWQQHPSGRTYHAEMMNRVSPEDVRDCGNEFQHAGCGAALLWWLKENGTKTSGGPFPVSIADYVARAVVGRISPATHNTMACSFGIRASAGEWNYGMMESLFNRDVFMPLSVGEIEEVGHYQGIPVLTPVGDQQAALLGANLTEGELSINIGTGAQVSVMTRERMPGDYQTRPYFGRWLNTVTHLPGGRALNIMASIWGDPKHACCWMVDGEDKPTAIEVVLPNLSKQIPGAILSIGESNLTMGGIFRASFDDMAETYHDAALDFDGDKCKSIVFSGGVARRLPTLCKVIADRFGLPYRMADDHDTLRGLLRLAKAGEQGRDVHEVQG